MVDTQLCRNRLSNTYGIELLLNRIHETLQCTKSSKQASIGDCTYLKMYLKHYRFKSDSSRLSTSIRYSFALRCRSM